MEALLLAGCESGLGNMTWLCAYLFSFIEDKGNTSSEKETLDTVVKTGAREMSLSVTALPEDVGLVASTHMSSQSPAIPIPGDLNHLFSFYR